MYLTDFIFCLFVQFSIYFEELGPIRLKLPDCSMAFFREFIKDRSVIVSKISEANQSSFCLLNRRNGFNLNIPTNGGFICIFEWHETQLCFFSLRRNFDSNPPIFICFFFLKSGSSNYVKFIFLFLKRLKFRIQNAESQWLSLGMWGSFFNLTNYNNFPFFFVINLNRNRIFQSLCCCS